MKQKKFFSKRNIKNIFLISGMFALVLFVSPSCAQEMIPVVSDSVGASEILGTPVDEIISAASSGGLSGAYDLSALKQDVGGKVLGISVSSETSSVQPQPVPSSAFSSDSLKNLESQGGLSSDPQISADTPSVFNLAVKFFEKVVFKKDVEFAGRPVFDDGLDISGKITFDNDTAGYAIIKEGNQSVVVEFDHDYGEPPVVTATLSLQQYKDSEVRSLAEEVLFLSDVKYIITNVSKKGFEIMMDKKADSDIPFSWHALAVNDPTTSKKKGGTLKNKIGSESDSKFSAEESSSAGSAAPASVPANSADTATQSLESSQLLTDPNPASANTSN